MTVRWHDWRDRFVERCGLRWTCEGAKGRTPTPPVVIHGRSYSPGPDGRWYDDEGGSFTEWQVESYAGRVTTPETGEEVGDGATPTRQAAAGHVAPEGRATADPDASPRPTSPLSGRVATAHHFLLGIPSGVLPGTPDSCTCGVDWCYEGVAERVPSFSCGCTVDSDKPCPYCSDPAPGRVTTPDWRDLNDEERAAVCRPLLEAGHTPCNRERNTCLLTREHDGACVTPPARTPTAASADSRATS